MTVARQGDQAEIVLLIRAIVPECAPAFGVAAISKARRAALTQKTGRAVKINAESLSRRENQIKLCASVSLR